MSSYKNSDDDKRKISRVRRMITKKISKDITLNVKKGIPLKDWELSLKKYIKTARGREEYRSILKSITSTLFSDVEKDTRYLTTTNPDVTELHDADIRSRKLLATPDETKDPGSEKDIRNVEWSSGGQQKMYPLRAKDHTFNSRRNFSAFIKSAFLRVLRLARNFWKALIEKVL